MRLIILGAPGSGKGTQAAKLSHAFGIPPISTGEMLRAACKEKTSLGLKAMAFMSRGRLVPDEVVIGVIEERIKASDCQRGYILDGFPRTVVQAERFAEILKGQGAALDAVCNFIVGEAEAVKRMTGRRLCRLCQAAYHVEFQPPIKEGVCDRCQGELYQRDDDKEAVIQHRLEVYRRQTEPLIDYYGRSGLLVAVDASGAPDEIFERLRAVLRKAGGR